MKRWTFMPVMLACLALVGVLAVGVVSLRSQLTQLNREATELRERERQEQLLAGFLDQLRRQNAAEIGSGLPLPEHGTLAPERLPQLDDVFRGPAVTAGVELTRLKVDVSSLKGDYRRLLVEVEVSGSQSTVRAYLLEICRVPCLLRLESVALKRLDESRLQMVLGLVLELA